MEQPGRIRSCTYRVLYPEFLIAVLATTLSVILQAIAAPSHAQEAPRPAEITAVPARACTITVKYTENRPLNKFRPEVALGAGVDGLEQGDIDKVYTQPNVKAMLSAGFKSLSYRLRTELGDEAWHWNPAGRWSDPANNQGYWTSSSHLGSPILTCYGYSLPRRGNTIDQANNTGYSRILDNDPASFWKSNPYLDTHFTGDLNIKHPQWIVIDIGKRIGVNAIQILWAVPFAVKYQVEYCVGHEPPGDFDQSWQEWRRFPGGRVTSGAGGNQLLKLSRMPIITRYVRIMLLTSSCTGPDGSADIRDRIGFAVREIYLGTFMGSGKLHDVLKHGRTAATQTAVYVSSTDPWHRSVDIDRNIEQPGIDRVFKSGLTNGLAALLPVGVLYDIPQNAAEFIKYIRARNYPIRGIELGEEPDGQQILPEDYASLYLQWAKALHKVDHKLKLGGPGLQTSVGGYRTWEDESGNRSWVSRFLGYMASHRQSSAVSFYSFEWYPFDDGLSAPEPERAKSLMNRVVRQFLLDGVPHSIPWIITEYGYSSFAGQPEVEMPGALVNAETVAQFLSLGGSAAYYYGYEPSPLMREAGPSGKTADSWGNLTLFVADDNRQIKSPLAAYHAARMLTQDWVSAADGLASIYSAASDLRNPRGEEMISAYPLFLEGGKWSLLVLNKDRTNAAAARIRFASDSGADLGTLIGPLELAQYCPKQYVWHANGLNGYAAPNDPPSHISVNSSDVVLLPAYSITVIRGTGPQADR
jgi:hypothetical protein